MDSVVFSSVQIRIIYISVLLAISKLINVHEKNVPCYGDHDSLLCETSPSKVQGGKLNLVQEPVRSWSDMEEEPDGHGQGEHEYHLSICTIFCEFYCCWSKIAEFSAFSSAFEYSEYLESVLLSLPCFHISLFCIKRIH